MRTIIAKNGIMKQFFAHKGIKFPVDKTDWLAERVARVVTFKDDNMVSLYDHRGRFITQMHYRSAYLRFGNLM